MLHSRWLGYNFYEMTLNNVWHNLRNWCEIFKLELLYISTILLTSYLISLSGSETKKWKQSAKWKCKPKKGLNDVHGAFCSWYRVLNLKVSKNLNTSRYIKIGYVEYVDLSWTNRIQTAYVWSELLPHHLKVYVYSLIIFLVSVFF